MKDNIQERLPKLYFFSFILYSRCICHKGVFIMGNHSVLINLNERLYEYTRDIENKFLSVKLSGEKGDFLTEVKPFADEVQVISEHWKKEATAWITKNRPRNLHESQIDSAAEQIEMISVQSFFPETSRTRFINYLQSVRFVLTLLRANLDKYEK